MQAHEADKGADAGPSQGADADSATAVTGDAVTRPLWRQAIERAVRLLWSRVVEGVDRVLEFGADVVDSLTDGVPGKPRQRISDTDAAVFITFALVLGSVALGVLLAVGAGLVGLVRGVRDLSVWTVVSGWHGFGDGVDWLASGPGAPVTAYLAAHSQGLPWTGEQLLLGWATTGLVLWVLAAGSYVRAAQLTWPLYVAATAAMAYQGTAGPSAPVVAGIVAVAGLVLAVPALRRGAGTSTRVVVEPARVPAVSIRTVDTPTVNLTSTTP